MQCIASVAAHRTSPGACSTKKNKKEKSHADARNPRKSVYECRRHGEAKAKVRQVPGLRRQKECAPSKASWRGEADTGSFVFRRHSPFKSATPSLTSADASTVFSLFPLMWLSAKHNCRSRCRNTSTRTASWQARQLRSCARVLGDSGQLRKHEDVCTTCVDCHDQQ